MSIPCIIRKEVQKRHYKVVFVKHEIVSDHIAIYNVIYNKRHFQAPNRNQQKERAERIRVPLNQIWISKKFRKAVGPILFHELNELKYRRQGMSISSAHKLAKKDEAKYKFLG